MTKFDGTSRENERRFCRGKYPRHAVAPSRSVNPLLGVLGALVFSGYLMMGHPFNPATMAPAPSFGQRLAPEQVPPQPALSKATGSLPHSGVAQHESTFSSMNDLLKAAFAAAFGLAWAVFGVWLAGRRARRPKPLRGPEACPTRTAYASVRAPTCERMYDETRLVPQYLRSAEFPATKQDLVRLARVHTEEGQALRRLECVPDRRYSSLHDLISEIRVD